MAGLPASAAGEDIMEFDEVSKKAAAAIGEAEKVAPIGMFCQLLHQLNAALTRPKQWPMVAREAAFTALERIAQLSVRISFELARAEVANQKAQLSDRKL